ncbi:myosin-binding protein 7-like [Canna indica]|uniref:Myosin-binding protein 7-like n=1 Tax=Canna indica TaxID=4628 RepID=A0AAQ3QB78_9LILI|nr:myosin-binding protein 7-like [Canna indica]
MDSEEPPTALPGERRGSAERALGTCASACHSCCSTCVPSSSWRRSLKRKLGTRDTEVCTGNEAGAGIARVEIETEVAALREALVSYQQSVKELQTELEEERSAAASSATEAMAMILRLQREKAEAVMEVRQFKRLAEGKMAHNQLEIAALEDLLFNRDQTVQALFCEVQAYRHRLLSYGLGIDGDAVPTERQIPGTATATCSIPQFDLLPCDYPPLRCASDDSANYDKYPSRATPPEHLRNLDERIFQLERMPSGSFYGILDKRVIVGQSPPRHLSRHLSFSYGSYGSGLEFNKREQFQKTTDCGRRDDASDRVCTVDGVNESSKDYLSTPKELHNQTDVVGKPRELQNMMDAIGGVEEAEIKKLYMKLQALDADRESMRQTLLSFDTDKAQMVLLKEIAEQMCKEGAPAKIVKKPHSGKRFSFISIIKSAFSFFWRKEPTRVRYTFGLSPSNVGLLLLLDKSIYSRHRWLLTRTQG